MDLDEQQRRRLAALRTIGLTTFGRRTGLPRRIEIWWFHVDGRFVITGTPAVVTGSPTSSPIPGS